MRRRIEERFNDGAIQYGEFITERDEGTKKKKGTVFKANGILFFKYYSIRQEDSAMYGVKGKTVDLKLKTYYVPGVEKSQKVLLNGELYEITGIDPSNDRRYLFWYLSKAGDFKND